MMYRLSIVNVMFMCTIVTWQGLPCRRQIITHLISRVPDTHCACRLRMRSDPPITLVLNQCAKADQPLHMEWVAGNNIEKLATNKRKLPKNEDLFAKRKAMSVFWIKHVFCIDSALHLLPQREVTQLVWPFMSQLSTTKTGKISAG